MSSLPVPLPLERLVGFLPELEEVEELRLAMVGASVPDPATEWDSSRAYATVDKRVVPPDRIDQAVRDAEEAVHRQVRDLYAGVGPLLAALGEGRQAEAAARLIELGEGQERSGRYRKACECFRIALLIALPLPDKAAQILALRRIGRVSLALGDFRVALDHYQRSRNLARDACDRHGEVVAQTGCGNVLAVQGRWEDAEDCYRAALLLADEEPETALQVERAQLYNNLGMVATRRRLLEEAEEWFARALRVWQSVASEADLAICYHSLAQLREAQGRGEEARTLYRRALELAVPSAIRATITIDLAESCLGAGLVSDALRLGRQAEEHAIAARSPFYLAHMYRGLGNIARATGSEDGFTFFEKALEISRSKGYRFLEGETLVDYARLRLNMDETDEARAFLERAVEVFLELGAVHEVRRAEESLREVARRESGGRD
jgi:tetratricopeptide (TPR) repeat protein